MATLRHKLHEAIRANDVTAVSTVLQECSASDVNGVEVEHTALTCALQHCPDDVIPAILMTHDYFDVDAENRHGRTALFEAAKLGRDVIVTCLLLLGADVNACDLRAATPLIICALYNRHSTARLLLEHGADVTAHNREGDTALHCACSYGSKEVVELLLEHGGSDVNRLNQKGQSPLLCCLPSAYNTQVLHKPLSQAEAIFTSLWFAGCDVGLTHAQLALHERVLQDDVVGACLLVDACPSLLTVLNDKGWTPLQLAVSRGCWEMALCLLLHGSPPLPLLPTPPSLACSKTGPQPRDKTRLQSSLTTTPLPSTTTRSENHGVTSSAAGPGHRVTVGGWRDWHRQRFLQAVLEDSFLTPGSLQGLADLGLLTPDLLQLVHRQLTFPGPGQAESRDAEQGDSARRLPDWENATPAPRPREEVEREGGQEGEGTAALVVAAVQSSLRLQHQCRLVLRQHLSVALLTALPRSGLPRAVQNYVTLGVDMMTACPRLVTNLHLALLEDDVSTLHRLLQQGADVNCPVKQRLPLTRALELLPSHSDVTDCEVRLEQGDVCTLCGCCLLDDSTFVKDDVVSFSTMTSQPANGLESFEVLEALLRHGAKLTSQDPLGDTALHVAVTRGYCVVRRLVRVVRVGGRLAGPPDCPSVEQDEQDSSLAVVGGVLSLPCPASPACCHEVCPPGVPTALLRAQRPGAEPGGPQAPSRPLPRPATTRTADQSTGIDIAHCEGCDVIALTLSPRDRLGLTPLELALFCGDAKSLRLLLLWLLSEHRTGPDVTVLLGCETDMGAHRQDMSGTGDTARAADALQDTGSAVYCWDTACDMTGSARPDWRSPVTQVCCEGVPRLATWRSQTTGVTALHLVAAANLPRLVALLRTHGACPDTRDALGLTARDVAHKGPEVYLLRRHLLFPDWYDVSWKTELAVWPVTKPRPFGPQHVRHQASRC